MQTKLSDLINGDFKKYYDTISHHHYWVLGYFGGGAINITKALQIAKFYAAECQVPIETIVIDEIYHSRRYKGFKIMFSQRPQTPVEDAIQHTDVYKILTD